MIQFIKNCVIYGLICLVICACSIVAIGVLNPDSYLWSGNLKHVMGSYGATALKFQEADALKDDLDILFIGSSHSYRGFDPRIFDKYGVSSMNLGTSSQSPLNTLFLLEDYLPRLRPKQVVLETYYYFFAGNAGSTESSLDLISNVKSNDVRRKVAFQKFDLVPNLAYFYVPIVETFHDAADNQASTNDIYRSRGFVEHIGPMRAKEILKKDTLQMNETSFLALESITQLCKAYEADLILVHAPFTEEQKASFVNYNVYSDLMSERAQKNDLLWIDYNGRDKMNVPDSCFFDLDHLYQCGVELFNKDLIQKMKASGHWPE